MISFLDSSFTSFWLWKCFMKIKHNFVDIFWHVADFCVDPTFPWMCGFLAGYDMRRIIPNMSQYLRFVTKLKRYMVGLKKNKFTLYKMKWKFVLKHLKNHITGVHDKKGNHINAKLVIKHLKNHFIGFHGKRP